ncbi:jg14139, partial [Pararge aegeria aegeria]
MDGWIRIFECHGSLESRRDHDPCNWVEISTNPKILS